MLRIVTGDEKWVLNHNGKRNRQWLSRNERPVSPSIQIPSTKILAFCFVKHETYQPFQANGTWEGHQMSTANNLSV